MAPSLSVNDTGIIHDLGNGSVDEVRWDDLRRVEILTTDEGPFLEDFFWVLHGSAGGVVLDASDVERFGLLSRLQQLPGFDNEAVIRASCSTENARFLCWES